MITPDVFAAADTLIAALTGNGHREAAHMVSVVMDWVAADLARDVDPATSLDPSWPVIGLDEPVSFGPVVAERVASNVTVLHPAPDGLGDVPVETVADALATHTADAIAILEDDL